MEQIPEIELTVDLAFADLWRSEFSESELDGSYEKYQLPPTGDPEINGYAKYLAGLRVLCVDDELLNREDLDQVAALSKPGTVDIMVCYNYNEQGRLFGREGHPWDWRGTAGIAPWPYPVIPEGVQAIIFIKGDMTSAPQLPASVKMVIFEDCLSLESVDLSPSVQSLAISNTQDYVLSQKDNDMTDFAEIRITMPENLKNLHLSYVDRFYLQGPMAPYLETISCPYVGNGRADETLPRSLISAHYEIYHQYLLPSTKHFNELELPCTDQLETLDAKSCPFHVAGIPVSTFEEYQKACRRLSHKKSARSAYQ